MRLQDEQKSLLKGLPWVNEFAPEFSAYLRDFPQNKLTNVKNSIGWSKLKFGLKPVIVITQTITHNSEKNGISQILSVSKQIYASHYFDSSLGLTALANFAKADSANNTFLFYNNHSRSSSMGGSFSKIIHGVVDKEAIAKIEPLLRGAKTLAESGNQNKNMTNEGANDLDVTETMFGGNKLIWVFGLAAVFAIIFLIGKAIINK